MYSHISLYVSDINQTKDFYEKYFNQKATKFKDAYLKFELKNANLVISFIENKEKINPDFGHLGFRVETENELDELKRLALDSKIDILEEESTNCCYALQDKFWVRDPDGYMWEVYYFHSDSEFNDPRYQEEKASACCSPSFATLEIKK